MNRGPETPTPASPAPLHLGNSPERQGMIPLLTQPRGCCPQIGNSPETLPSTSARSALGRAEDMETGRRGCPAHAHARCAVQAHGLTFGCGPPHRWEGPHAPFADEKPEPQEAPPPGLGSTVSERQHAGSALRFPQTRGEIRCLVGTWPTRPQERPLPYPTQRATADPCCPGRGRAQQVCKHTTVGEAL